ncbi:MAG: OmpA family protein [Phycisphaerales bacterium]
MNPEPNKPARSDDLDEVRRILVGPEAERLNKVEASMADQHWQSQLVARVLPQAVALRTAKDSQLARALAPTVERSIKNSIEKNPQPIVDAISPVMGPAIRKSIADALAGLAAGLNAAVKDTFTLAGLSRRLRAWRTGIPYAELALLENMPFVPEQAFLVHRETGLLLLHALRQNVEAQDADTVSGMFTAIRDFVRESFKAGDAGSLSDIRVGEVNVLIEQGQKAFIAVTVRGTATPRFRERVIGAVEQAHIDYGGDLSSFQGDASPFTGAKTLLEDLLDAKSIDPSQTEAARPKTTFERLRRLVLPLLIVVLFVVACFLLLWHFWWVPRSDRIAFEQYVRRLRGVPGVLVSQTGFDGGRWWSNSDDRWIIVGQADPAASPRPSDESALGDARGLIIESRWEPYLSLDPTFVKDRAIRTLKPPPGVSVSSENGVLVLSGRADHQWIVRARRDAQSVVGVSRIDDRGLVDVDLVTLGAVRDRLEALAVRFTFATSDMVPGQENTLSEMTAEIFKLYDAARKAGIEFTIQVVGHTDSSGQEERNVRLSRDRADRVISLLVARGVRTRELAAVGVGYAQPRRTESTDRDKEQNRRVALRVLFLQQPLFIDDAEPGTERRPQ